MCVTAIGRVQHSIHDTSHTCTLWLVPRWTCQPSKPSSRNATDAHCVLPSRTRRAATIRKLSSRSSTRSKLGHQSRPRTRPSYVGQSTRLLAARASCLSVDHECSRWCHHRRCDVVYLLLETFVRSCVHIIMRFEETTTKTRKNQ